MKIPISEIFFSLQGEGRNTGKPSIFVRLWGCNLKCTWCDSKYSWDSKEEKATMMELDEVIEIIKGFNCNHIIFTGGEPSLFQDQILAIQDKLGNSVDGFDYYVYEIETNGSKKLSNKLDLSQSNISPKLGMSGNDEYEMEIFQSTGWTGKKDLKFVIGNLEDIKEMEVFLRKYEEETKDMGIYIMPLGRDFESQMNKIVMNYCMKKGYNFCMRSHLIWFGDGKGK